MTVTIFRSKKSGNWILPCADGKLAIVNGELTAADAANLVNTSEGRVVGDNILYGFTGAESAEVEVNTLKAKAQAGNMPKVVIVAD